MTLQEYLKQNKIKVNAFADLLEVNRAYLSRIIHRKKNLSKRLARNIEMLTNGLVKKEELMIPISKEKKCG